MNNNPNITLIGKFGIIYIARNKINNKCYIGYTIKKLEKRKQLHLKDSRTKNHKFSKAISKYGWENFEWNILYDNVPSEKLEIMERWTIMNFDSYENGYNTTLGGDGMLGFKHSEETKLKLAEKGLGKKHSKESIEKMCIVQRNLNKHYGEETRRKMSLAAKGRASPRFTGKHHTEESKEAMRNALKGKKFSKEVCEKRSISKTGIKQNKKFSSKYVGVSFCKKINKWKAKFKEQYLGVFETEEQAALRYNEEAIKIYGDKAKINKIGGI